MSQRPGRSSPVRAAAGIGAVAAAMICCAGPALIGAGALGVTGAALRNPVIVLGGGLFFLGALGTALFGRQRGVKKRGRSP
jgi:mercuric ion transport protein